MTTYIILSRFSPEAFEDPKNFKDLAAAVSAKIKKQCPDITWKGSFATLGRFDVVDLVDAEDPMQIEKAAMIIRAYGHSMTETLVATPWKEFLAAL
ncbi:MAG: GYD domain-containing protein [Acidobacteriia bacterium]|nr:GYD domain-containing protein [Terriglobia bacterium]